MSTIVKIILVDTKREWEGDIEIADGILVTRTTFDDNNTIHRLYNKKRVEIKVDDHITTVNYTNLASRLTIEYNGEKIILLSCDDASVKSLHDLFLRSRLYVIDGQIQSLRSQNAAQGSWYYVITLEVFNDFSRADITVKNGKGEEQSSHTLHSHKANINDLVNPNTFTLGDILEFLIPNSHNSNPVDQVSVLIERHSPMEPHQETEEEQQPGKPQTPSGTRQYRVKPSSLSRTSANGEIRRTAMKSSLSSENTKTKTFTDNEIRDIARGAFVSQEILEEYLEGIKTSFTFLERNRKVAEAFIKDEITNFARLNNNNLPNGIPFNVSLYQGDRVASSHQKGNGVPFNGSQGTPLSQSEFYLSSSSSSSSSPKSADVSDELEANSQGSTPFLLSDSPDENEAISSPSEQLKSFLLSKNGNENGNSAPTHGLDRSQSPDNYRPVRNPQQNGSSAQQPSQNMEMSPNFNGSNPQNQFNEYVAHPQQNGSFAQQLMQSMATSLNFIASNPQNQFNEYVAQLLIYEMISHLNLITNAQLTLEDACQIIQVTSYYLNYVINVLKFTPIPCVYPQITMGPQYQHQYCPPNTQGAYLLQAQNGSPLNILFNMVCHLNFVIASNPQNQYNGFVARQLVQVMVQHLSYGQCLLVQALMLTQPIACGNGYQYPSNAAQNQSDYDYPSPPLDRNSNGYL